MSANNIKASLAGEPDAWVQVNPGADDDSIEPISDLSSVSRADIPDEQEAFNLAKYVGVQAHNKRLFTRIAKQKRTEWLKQLEKIKHKTKLRRLLEFYNQIPVVKHTFGVLFILVTYIFFFLWQLFAWADPHEKYDDMPLYIYWRIMTIMFALILVIYILVRWFFIFITWFFEERFVLDYWPFVLSITLFIWSIVCLNAYQDWGNNRIPTECTVASNTTVTISAQVLGSNACFTFDWAFTTTLVISILWFLRSLAEESILASLSIRPNSPDISMALLKEYHLHKLVQHMRKKSILPKRDDPKNILDNLDLKLPSLNEASMMDILEKSLVIEGRYADRSAQESELRQALKKQCMQMFASLDVENKGYLEPKDFRDIFGKKTARAFLVFDVGLNGTLDVMQFTTAIDEIYFSRQRVWDSYTDRRNMAGILRVVMGSVFWTLMLVLALLLANVSLKNVIIPAASIIISLSFAFGGVVSKMTESFVLTLVVRPFDVGDKICLDMEGPSFFVYKIGLFRTICFHVDNRWFSIPNTDMTTYKVQNMHRSKATTIAFTININHETPASSFVAFKESIENYLKENPDDFNYSNSVIYLDSIADMNRLVLGLWIELRGISWDMWGDAQNIKYELLLHIQRESKRLGIQWHQVPQRIEIYGFPAKPKGSSSSHSSSRSHRSRSTRSSNSHNNEGRKSRSHRSLSSHPNAAIDLSDEERGGVGGGSGHRNFDYLEDEDEEDYSKGLSRHIMIDKSLALKKTRSSKSSGGSGSTGSRSKPSLQFDEEGNPVIVPVPVPTATSSSAGSVSGATSRPSILKKSSPLVKSEKGEEVVGVSTAVSADSGRSHHHHHRKEKDKEKHHRHRHGKDGSGSSSNSKSRSDKGKGGPSSSSPSSPSSPSTGGRRGSNRMNPVPQGPVYEEDDEDEDEDGDLLGMGGGSPDFEDLNASHGNPLAITRLGRGESRRSGEGRGRRTATTTTRLSGSQGGDEDIHDDTIFNNNNNNNNNNNGATGSNNGRNIRSRSFYPGEDDDNIPDYDFASREASAGGAGGGGGGEQQQQEEGEENGERRRRRRGEGGGRGATAARSGFVGRSTGGETSLLYSHPDEDEDLSDVVFENDDLVLRNPNPRPTVQYDNLGGSDSDRESNRGGGSGSESASGSGSGSSSEGEGEEDDEFDDLDALEEERRGGSRSRSRHRRSGHDLR